MSEPYTTWYIPPAPMMDEQRRLEAIKLAFEVIRINPCLQIEGATLRIDRFLRTGSFEEPGADFSVGVAKSHLAAQSGNSEAIEPHE